MVKDNKVTVADREMDPVGEILVSSLNYWSRVFFKNLADSGTNSRELGKIPEHPWKDGGSRMHLQ